MNVYLHDPVYALGDTTYSVEESAAAARTFSSAATLREAGFAAHHVCSPQTGVHDLAARTALQLGERLDTISTLIFSTCLPANGNIGKFSEYRHTRDVKHLMDFPASRLQAACGLLDTQVIGLNQQACTGMLGGIRLARALLLAETDADDILCITADRFPADAVYEQSYNLISDGGAAVVVSRIERGFRIVGCHQITNGALVQASDDEAVGTYFNYTHRLVQESLARVDLEIANIDWIIAQNMNVKAWQILARLLSFDAGRVYFDSLPEVGHVISGDNVINLKRLDESEAIRPGEKLMLLMAGYGMNWQSVILEKV
jgi:3-oxoacyl-[acyl-carrier-protein] synthase III